MKKSKWPCTELFSWILSVWTSLSILAKFWNSTLQYSMYIIIHVPQPCYHGLVSSSLKKVWFHVDLKNEHFVLHMYPYFWLFPPKSQQNVPKHHLKKETNIPFHLDANNFGSRKWHKIVHTIHDHIHLWGNSGQIVAVLSSKSSCRVSSPGSSLYLGKTLFSQSLLPIIMYMYERVPTQ